MSEAHKAAQQRRREREAAGKQLPRNGSKVPVPNVKPPKLEPAPGKIVSAMRIDRAFEACDGVPTELLEPGILLKLSKYVNQQQVEIAALRSTLALYEGIE